MIILVKSRYLLLLCLFSFYSCTKGNKSCNTYPISNLELKEKFEAYYTFIERRKHKQDAYIYMLGFENINDTCYITMSNCGYYYDSLVFRRYTFLDDRLIIFPESEPSHLNDVPIHGISLNNSCASEFVDTSKLFVFNGIIKGYHNNSELVANDPFYWSFRVTSTGELERAKNSVHNNRD